MALLGSPPMPDRKQIGKLGLPCGKRSQVNSADTEAEKENFLNLTQQFVNSLPVEKDDESMERVLVALQRVTDSKKPPFGCYFAHYDSRQ